MTVAIINTKKNGIYETEVKAFSTMMNGIEAAMRWLLDHDCHVAGIHCYLQWAISEEPA